MKHQKIIFAIMFVALTLTSLSAWSNDEVAAHGHDATAAAAAAAAAAPATGEAVKANREPNSADRQTPGDHHRARRHKPAKRARH